MDTMGADATCIIDRDGIIVWASAEFVGLFAHRVAPVGARFSQLFSGVTDVCRHGAQLEDRDRAGRRRLLPGGVPADEQCPGRPGERRGGLA